MNKGENLNKSGGKPPEMKKSTKLFFSGVLVLTITNLIVKAIGLFFKIPMQTYLGDEGMGYFNSAYTIYTLFYMVSTAGLPVAVSLMISESRAKGNFKQAKKIYNTALWLFFIIGFVGMSAMLFGSKVFARIIDVDQSFYCIIACAPTLFFICLTSAMRGYFQGYQHMVPTAMSQLIEALGKLGIGILFALWAIKQQYALPKVAAFAMLGLTIGVVLGTFYLWISRLLFKESEFNAEYIHENSDNMPVESKGKILRRLVKTAVPITVSSSVMSLANLIDLVLVARCLQSNGLTEPEATALYGNYTTLAVPMFNLPPVLIYPIAYSVVPMLSALLANKNFERSKLVMESSIRTTAIISMPCALGMSVLSRPILSLFFGAESVDKGAPLLSILALAVFFIGMIAITNSILQAYKRESLPIISMCIGAGVKLITSYTLISNPDFGILGTPIGTLLCYMSVTIINIYFVAKYTGLTLSVGKVFWRPLIASVICAGSAMGVYYLLNRALGESRVVTLVTILIAAVVYFVMILLVKGISKEDVMLLPKGQKIYSALHRMKLMK